ncbi:hypothetical protein V3C99_002722, partial [Haemonchus contortus]
KRSFRPGIRYFHVAWIVHGNAEQVALTFDRSLAKTLREASESRSLLRSEYSLVRERAYPGECAAFSDRNSVGVLLLMKSLHRENSFGYSCDVVF